MPASFAKGDIRGVLSPTERTAAAAVAWATGGDPPQDVVAAIRARVVVVPGGDQFIPNVARGVAEGGLTEVHARLPLRAVCDEPCSKLRVPLLGASQFLVQFLVPVSTPAGRIGGHPVFGQTVRASRY
jgi:hypothetical protein